MDFNLTQEQQAFQKEVGKWLDEQMTPELAYDMRGFSWETVWPGELPASVREFTRKIVAKGWIGMDWPKKYGGQERSLIEQYIVVEELEYRHLRVYGFCAMTMVGPMLLAQGTEEQKMRFLPRIVRGELETALGYTEPQAGSDLAAVELRAEEHGDYYILNGQKMFSTLAHLVDYHWLAARTERTFPKHRGLSMFLVDLKSPGITIRPLRAMDGGRTNEVFYDDVRVPKENSVGEKNKGFYYAMEALDKERVMVLRFGMLRRLFDQLFSYAQKTKRDGSLVAANPLVRHRLAEFATEVEIARLLNYKALWMADNKLPIRYETALFKLYISEVIQRWLNFGMELMGLRGQLSEDSKWAPFAGEIRKGYEGNYVMTFGAGSSEIMRNIIALRGLGLPLE